MVGFLQIELLKRLKHIYIYIYTNNIYIIEIIIFFKDKLIINFSTRILLDLQINSKN